MQQVDQVDQDAPARLQFIGYLRAEDHPERRQVDSGPLS